MSSTVNDPRQPSAAKRYVPSAVAPQDLPVDYSGLIAVVFGLAGVMFRVLQVVLLGCDHILRSIAGEHEEHRERPQTDLHGHDVCYYGIGNQLLRTCSTGNTKELKLLVRDLRRNTVRFRFI
ncbi:hypothetical protein DVH24_023727 [Malus domestica]|uniref:Uncharacterized protein n=1 Tax=Malus domestica TaxID=3750 RepID=A0A498I8N4_MALDO|nr:hypothetical protein DVH24_023727 [Malus domestica]